MPWKSGRTLLVWSCVGLVLVAPVVLISYRPVDHWFDIGHHPLGVDFVNIWSAPRIAWREGVMAVFDPDAYYAALAVPARDRLLCLGLSADHAVVRHAVQSAALLARVDRVDVRRSRDLWRGRARAGGAGSA